MEEVGVITWPRLSARLGQAARDVVAGWDCRYSLGCVREVYRTTANAVRRTSGQRLTWVNTAALVSVIETVATRQK